MSFGNKGNKLTLSSIQTGYIPEFLIEFGFCGQKAMEVTKLFLALSTSLNCISLPTGSKRRDVLTIRMVCSSTLKWLKVSLVKCKMSKSDPA